jgi:hypothetical protein
VPEEIQPEAAPVDDGQGAEASGEAAESAGPEYFDPTPYADQMTRVTVNGEEIEVPVSELIGGYSRTADYTRKNQELAQQRQQLQFADAIARALESNPELAVRTLQERYGLLQQEQPDEEDEFLDPLERRLNRVEREFETRAQRDADEQLARDVEDAAALWEDVDGREAVAYALERGWQGPTAIADAFAAIAGQKVLVERAAQRQYAEQQKQREDAATAAKRNLNGAVEQGGGAPAGSVGSGSHQASSIREAWEMAKREHGIS